MDGRKFEDNEGIWPYFGFRVLGEVTWAAPFFCGAVGAAAVILALD